MFPGAGRLVRAAHAITGLFVGLLFTEPLVHAASDLIHRKRPDFTSIFLRPPSEPNLRAYENALEDNSPLVRVARPAMQQARLQLLRDGGEKTLVAQDEWMYYKPAVQYLAQQLPEAKMTQALEAVADFHRQLAARGIELLVVPVPDKASAYPQFLNDNLHASTLASHGQRFLRFLEQRGIPAVDLYGLLAAPAPALYLKRDTHWTPAGLEVAAQAVAARLRMVSGLQFDTVKYRVEEMSLGREGDLLRMIQAERATADLAKETVAAQQVQDPTGKPFLPQDDAQILVLGDSFLRIYEKDEPGSAGFVAHLARALGVPLSAIISDGGAANLVREDLRRRPGLLTGKRAVVWEFAERDLGLAPGGWKNVAIPQAKESY